VVNRLRRASALAVGVALLAGLPAGPARGESAEQARAAARAATTRVESLQPAVDRALRDYEQTLGRLASGVGRSISADQAADAAAAAAGEARGRAGDRVRALYMTGGSSALYASVLDSASAGEALRRVVYVQRLVGVGAAALHEADTATGRARLRAARVEARLAAETVTAAEVQQRYETLVGTLAAATAEVTVLSERARNLEEVQTLLARIAALDAAVAATGEDRVATARAGVAPASFRALYVAAARTCDGLPWSVLAAIGQVESGHGANPGVSYAGAQGPMQFMPATWAAYAVDGDGDGDTDIQEPADSVFTAARYLCANGAGRSDAALARAIWHYNHAEWYVQLVLKLAGQYAGRDGA